MKKVGCFSILVAAAVLAFAVITQVQQPKKVPRIGFLGFTSLSAIAARIEGFRQALRELGYVEGKNIFIEWRYAEGKSERLSILVAELVLPGGSRIAVLSNPTNQSVPALLKEMEFAAQSLGVQNLCCTFHPRNQIRLF
jgi:ABC-type uncharacterized transport system substrate-binding protein